MTRVDARTHAPRNAGWRERGPAGGERTVAAAFLLSAVAVALGAVVAAPVYETTQFWVVAAAAWGSASVIVWLGRRAGWGALTLVVLLGAYVVLLVPLAVPDALGHGVDGWARGLGDGLAAVALGWKQLLTLSLPVASYQAVLVPWYTIVFGSTAALVWLALRSEPVAVFAAIPAVFPVVFGTVFGAAQVSAPLHLGPIQLTAPHETFAWGGIVLAAGGWIRWISGRARREAIRLGLVDEARRGGGTGTASHASSEPAEGERREQASTLKRRCIQAGGAVGTVAIALTVGSALTLAPGIGDDRTVARDHVDPEIVLAAQSSPLAAYRLSKRDAQFAAPLFTVAPVGTQQLPARLRLAVLDHYDGVDFVVGDGELARFTRFPSGAAVAEPTTVAVTFTDAASEGATDGWLPLAPPLAAPPAFTGQRADQLADRLYINRETGAAVIATPAGRSSALRDGDGYIAEMSGAGDAVLDEQPSTGDLRFDEQQFPQLTAWLIEQRLPRTGSGLLQGIDRLRERGYLSHSLTVDEGERDWFTAVQAAYGSTFVPSAGGHSIARIELLFQQLNEQQQSAGETSDDAALVAAIGDDEQFAAAAALLARAMGFDSRVVIGVRLGASTEAPQSPEQVTPGIPLCTAECTGEHLAAWTEVRGADGVWAAIDVSPQAAVPPSTIQRGEQLPAFPTVPLERDASEADPPVGTSGQNSELSDPAPATETGAVWLLLGRVGLGLLALVLLAVVVCFIPFAKVLRRSRRRRATSPELRALGAWDELSDAYADQGIRPRAHTGRREAADLFGAPAAGRIAAVVDRAVFARESIDTDEATALWELVDRTLADQRDTQSRTARWRSRLSLRSFRAENTRQRSRNRQRNTVGNGGAHGLAQ